MTDCILETSGLVKEFKGFVAVGGGLGRKAPGPHQFGQPAAGRGIVLDDQDAFSGVHDRFGHHSSVPSPLRARGRPSFPQTSTRQGWRL